MKLSRPLAALALCIATLAAGAQNAELPASPSEIKAPSFKTFVAQPPTRLEVHSASGDFAAPLLIIEDHQLPLVFGLLLFEAGSLREPEDKSGLADLYVEGLREGGCSEFTGAEFNSWLDSHAVELSMQMTQDHLRISFSCLREDLEGTLLRVGQLLRSPAFDGRAVEVGRMQILNGIARAKEDSAELATQAMNRVLFGNTSHFGRSATAASVSSIAIDDLKKYHDSNVGLDRVTVGISGDVTAAMGVDIATQALGGLGLVGTASALPTPVFWSPERTTIYVVDRPGVPQTELLLGGIGVRIDDPSHAPLTLWSYVVGAGGMSNRITQRVRTDLGLAYMVGCGFSGGLARPGQFYAYCGTRNEAVGDALSEMLEVITATGSEIIPKEELNAARARLLGSQVFRYDSADEQLERAMTLQVNALPSTFWETNLDRLRQVTPSSVAMAVRNHIPPARFLCVAVGPADEIIPYLETVANVVLLSEDTPIANSSKDAQQAIDTMFTVLGGKERWRDLTSVYTEQVAKITYKAGTAEVPVLQWRTFEPLQIRMRQRMMSGLFFTNVISKGEGWLQAPSGVSSVSADSIQVWKTQMQRWIYYTLHRLAQDESSITVSIDSEGRIVLTEDSGQLCWITLDSLGRPASMGVEERGASKVYTYEEWSEADGFPYISRFKEGENQTIEVSKFVPNVEIEEGTFSL
jgi:zinc protease